MIAQPIVPVCTADYARQHQLQQNPGDLRHCTLLHDRRAWSHDSGTDEWFIGYRNFPSICRLRDVHEVLNRLLQLMKPRRQRQPAQQHQHQQQIEVLMAFHVDEYFVKS